MICLFLLMSFRHTMGPVFEYNSIVWSPSLIGLLDIEQV